MRKKNVLKRKVKMNFLWSCHIWNYCVAENEWFMIRYIILMKIQKMFKEHINFKYIDLYMKNEYISFGIIRMLWHDTILCYFNCEEILMNSMVILRKKCSTLSSNDIYVTVSWAFEILKSVKCDKLFILVHRYAQTCRIYVCCWTIMITSNIEKKKAKKYFINKNILLLQISFMNKMNN